jgi:hypothetical protein
VFIYILFGINEIDEKSQRQFVHAGILGGLSLLNGHNQSLVTDPLWMD